MSDTETIQAAPTAETVPAVEAAKEAAPTEARGPAETPTRPNPKGSLFGVRQSWRRLRVHWRRRIIGPIDQDAVIARLDEGAARSGHLAFMLVLASALAALGLLLSSPVVMIAALLIAPLAAPLNALGFALARFSYHGTLAGLATVLAGALLGGAVAAAVVLLSPVQTLTPAMLALTRPSFLQLLVAVVAGLTAGYAAVRRQGEMLAGAVVAAALLPSLTVVGFGAATMNGVVFVGALALFLTGLVVILFCSAFVAKLYGFASFGEKPTPLQTIAVMTVLLVLSLPLAMALRQVALESATTRQAREIIVQYFGDDARLSRLEMDFTSEPTVARATVQAIHRRLDADRQIGERLTAAVGRPVTAQVSQVLVDGAASRRERERQELEAAKKEEGESLKRANEAEAEVIAGELSVIGASTPDAVIVDRIGRRASLSAEPAPGVLLPAWRELETRVAKRHPGWSIIVLPPMAPLPLVPFADGSDSLSREGLEAVADAAWALSRWGIKSAVVNGRVASGESETADGLNELARARAEAVKKALAERGILIASRTSTSGSIQRAAEARYGRGTLRSVEILPDTGDRGVRAAR